MVHAKYDCILNCCFNRVVVQDVPVENIVLIKDFKGLVDTVRIKMTVLIIVCSCRQSMLMLRCLRQK